ncbi:DNA-binding MarR family transcriptional regulator [Kaistia hirudinis]|uniref:DNA-binding MarR family transcriptional regulator n=1 Tax=Kaistia hirudinis TaxID=1293440 RepID=A0A840ANN6_9HYPH|nr:MarR family winged helix-turn-helix transcriptional regulator [Kaistia hirudinis]MBB3931242.1 DNA-binding MarR family transcriptional regulator [Kaistia hirudinis]
MDDTSPPAIPTHGDAPAAPLPVATVLEIRDRCLCLAAQRAARRLARRFDRLFAPLGLTNGQFSLLVALSGGWKPRLGELADFLAMDPTTVTASVKTLRRGGFVELMSDTEDARVRRPKLTDAGRAILQEAVPMWRAEHARVDAELDAELGAEAARDAARLLRALA